MGNVMNEDNELLFGCGCGCGSGSGSGCGSGCGCGCGCGRGCGCGCGDIEYDTQTYFASVECNPVTVQDGDYKVKFTCTVDYVVVVAWYKEFENWKYDITHKSAAGTVVCVGVPNPVDKINSEGKLETIIHNVPGDSQHGRGESGFSVSMKLGAVTPKPVGGIGEATASVSVSVSYNPDTFNKVLNVSASLTNGRLNIS